MDKNKVTWIGLGQAGGNIAQIAEVKYNYQTICINTSKEDLSSLRNIKYPIWIQNGIGAAKDRKRVIRLMSESIDDIVDKINNLVVGDIVIVVFSGAGGTGSGSSSFSCRYLVGQGKIVVPVVILPSDEESAKGHANTYDCLAELMQINGIGSTFLLDNSRVKDKFSINNKFVSDIDALLSLNHSSKYGNIDEAEIRTLLSCTGVAIISRSSKVKSTTSDVIQGLNENIYATVEAQNARYFALSTSNRSLDVQDILRPYKGIYDVFTGISEATTIAVLAGLQFPMKRIEKFKNKFEETVQNINNTINQQPPTIQPLQSLSFAREESKSTTPVNPRDILLSLLG